MSSKKARKFLLTINNPREHNELHSTIKQKLEDISGIKYWCMCDEMGTTHHTHLFIWFINPRTVQTIKNLFPTAHIDIVKGTAQENRDYIRKEGKHADTDKAETNIKGTFEESDDLPEERQGKRSDWSEVWQMIEDGCTTNEIIDEFPHFIPHRKTINEQRQAYIQKKFSEQDRDLYVEYRWGKPGTGKSRTIREKHKSSDVYVVTDYEHPFDGYDCQSVIVFEEFHGDLPITSMLNYLDRYPVQLPARYSNKTACYTTVYINSNIPLSQQYPEVQRNEPDTFQALKRRINKEIPFL